MEPVTREEAVGMLARIEELNGYIGGLMDERDALKAAVRAVLEDDREPLIDGEHGLVATLRDKNKPATVDVISFARKPENAQHLAYVAQSGLLNVALTAARALKGKSAAVDELLRYEMPGGGTTELRIERTE
jgi:Arc/MetJ family transcription regulator